ncbi:MAG: hypothetical protein U5L45_16030 [Saprospiraceae bacterium]|nr:hypothetical protein [Saprospiraceae bacterium]
MVRFSGFARKTNHLSSLARAKRARGKQLPLFISCSQDDNA